MSYLRKAIAALFLIPVLLHILLLPAGATELLEEDPEALKYAQEAETVLLEEAVEVVSGEEAPEFQEEVVLEEVLEEIPEELPEEILPEEPLEEVLPAEPAETIPEELPAEETQEEAPVSEEAVLPPLERVNFTQVPLYFQTDYPTVRYGSGTVETSGCSVTCLAMVASYMTDHEYRPDELARYFGGRAENNMARLEYGCEQLQIPFEKNYNWHVTRQALQEGKIAIVLVNQKSIFTDSQHFIVLTGLTEEGKVLVHDPFAPNYAHWELKQGFENGFTDYQITNGFSGAWVFDPAAMTEDPFLYIVEEPVPEESRYGGLELTDAETELLARVVWAEARGECFEGQQAVAEVVLNRLVSENFANTIHEVVFGEGQFRSVPYLEEAEPSQAQYQAVEAALYGPNILPLDVVYFATWQTTGNVWGQIEHHIFCYPE